MGLISRNRPTDRQLRRWLSTGRLRKVEALVAADPDVGERLERLTELDHAHIEALVASVEPPKDFLLSTADLNSPRLRAISDVKRPLAPEKETPSDEEATPMTTRTRRLDAPDRAPSANGFAVTGGSDASSAPDPAMGPDWKSAALELAGGVHDVGRRLRPVPPCEHRLRGELSVASRLLEGQLNKRSEVSPRQDLTEALGLLSDARRALDARDYPSSSMLMRAAEAAMDPDKASNGSASSTDVSRDQFVYETRLVERSRTLASYSVACWGVLLASAIAVTLRLPDGASGSVLRNLGALLTVVGLGLSAAILAGLVVRRAPNADVTAFISPVAVMALRLGTAGLTALGLVVLLQSDVQEVIDATGTKAYPFALVAGLSALLIDRALEQDSDAEDHPGPARRQ